MNQIRTRYRRGSLAVIAAAETAQNTNSGPISPHPAGPGQALVIELPVVGKRPLSDYSMGGEGAAHRLQAPLPDWGCQGSAGVAHKGGRCGPG